MEHSSSNGTFDPTQRRLCPDGSCVGLIGPDGRCGECGRTEAQAAAGDDPVDVLPRDDAEGAVAETSDAASGDSSAPSGATGITEGGFDPRRRLCDDGACVGVIGDDGQCRVCGRRSE